MNIDFDHWKGNQIADDLQLNLSEQRELQIIAALKPELSKDGDQYCYLYGELPECYVIGFGDTVALAVSDFCKNYWTQKAVPNSVGK